MRPVHKDEIAAAIILPHWEAVRDVFSAFVPGDDASLSKVNRIKFTVDSSFHDSPRHFAATTDDGLEMFFAPHIVDLDEEFFVAIIAHEFGHALDFLYPARWIMPPAQGRAVWIEDPHSYEARKWNKLWHTRSRDQIEWAADGIVWAVTGKRILYGAGGCPEDSECTIQRFKNGFARPKGLR